jgi:transcriptional regulator with XRE-family HTH domain
MSKEEIGNPEWVRVGATLRALREIRGFKPDAFASSIDISRPYLANIEAGRKKLTNVLLARAAAMLQVEQVAIMWPSEDAAA